MTYSSWVKSEGVPVRSTILTGNRLFDTLQDKQHRKKWTSAFKQALTTEGLSQDQSDALEVLWKSEMATVEKHKAPLEPGGLPVVTGAIIFNDQRSDTTRSDWSMKVQQTSCDGWEDQFTVTLERLTATTPGSQSATPESKSVPVLGSFQINPFARTEAFESPSDVQTPGGGVSEIDASTEGSSVQTPGEQRRHLWRSHDGGLRAREIPDIGSCQTGGVSPAELSAAGSSAAQTLDDWLHGRDVS